jgi:hypothetical protein
MTIGGWTFMLCSVGAVASLAAWCFWKVLSLPPEREDPVDPSGD